jgi:predicted  nucleic acid-binding Zn-ribbon protein
MDEARILLELQDLDLKVLRLNKRLDEMPEKRSILSLRAKLADVKNLLERSSAVGRVVDARLARLEDEAGAVTVKMEAEQAKLLSGQVKNPKELQAISMELDSLKRRRDALENDELAEMAKREDADAQETKVRAVLEAGARKEAELVADFKKQGSALVSEIEQLTARREALVGSLAAELVARYESIREVKHGIGVGVLDGHMCGACRVSLPNDQLERLASGPPIGTCPKCQRLIVVEHSQ